MKIIGNKLLVLLGLLSLSAISDIQAIQLDAKSSTFINNHIELRGISDLVLQRVNLEEKNKKKMELQKATIENEKELIL